VTANTLLPRPPWIQDRYAEIGKILDVSSDEGQVMFQSGGSNQSVHHGHLNSFVVRARADSTAQRSPIAFVTGNTFASSNEGSSSFSSQCSN
jgi:hypothetical protein